MAFLIWKDDYSVGVPLFDEQHRTLFSLINDFVEALKRGEEAGQAGRTLQGLLDYTTTHFKAEEDLMLRHGYPDYGRHKEAHDRFAATVKGFASEARNGTLDTGRLGRLLMDWLVQHILHMDRAYTDFFRERGVG